MWGFQKLFLKLLLLSLILGLVAFIIGCTGTALEGAVQNRPAEIVVQATVILPTPTPRPTLTPQPTPTSLTLVSIEETLAPLKTALENYQDPEVDRIGLTQAFRRTVGSFLAAAPQPLTQTTVETLTTGLEAILPAPAEAQPIVVLSDLDGDGQLDLVIGLPRLHGVPAMAFISGQNYTGTALPGVEGDLTGEPDDLLLYGWPATASVEEVTGDNRPELLVAYTVPGGSGITDRLYTFRWQPDQQAFETIFQATLISWAAEATWEMQSGPANSQQFVLTGPAFGPFDHKLLPHPTRTQLWRWDETAGRFTLAQETLSVPETPRQQFNLAESLLRQGAYEEASLEFQKVFTLTPSAELAAMEDSSTDWVALAHLRLGQTYALMGQPEAARAELSQAQAAGSVIGELATAFLRGYEEDEVTPAWVAMRERVDLYELFYNETEGNLGFPVDAFGFYYPGLAVAAYLDRHPEALTESAEELLINLLIQDLSLKAVLIEDLSGDGQPEVVFVDREWQQNVDRLWLAYQQGNRWRVSLLTEWDSLWPEGVTPLPSGDTMLVVTFPSASVRPPAGYGWSPEGVIVYNLEGDVPQPQPRQLWPTLGGM